MGLRLRWLGTHLLTWRDLLVIVQGAPRTSAIARSVAGAEADWGALEHLQALTFDAIQWTNYLLQHQINPNAQPPKPRPVSRPGAKEQGTRLGSDPIPISEFEDWWSSN